MCIFIMRYIVNIICAADLKIYIRVWRPVACRVLANGLLLVVVVTTRAGTWNRVWREYLIHDKTWWHDTRLGGCKLGSRATGSVIKTWWRSYARSRVSIRTGEHRRKPRRCFSIFRWCWWLRLVAILSLASVVVVARSANKLLLHLLQFLLFSPLLKV